MKMEFNYTTNCATVKYNVLKQVENVNGMQARLYLAIHLASVELS